MPQSGQDYSARRFHTDNYDCEPPPEVRTELNRPKRPLILGLRDRLPPGPDCRSTCCCWLPLLRSPARFSPGTARRRHSALSNPCTPRRHLNRPLSLPLPSQPGVGENTWNAIRRHREPCSYNARHGLSCSSYRRQEHKLPVTCHL